LVAEDSDAQTGGSDSAWLIPKLVIRLTGDERFSDDVSSVLDFWRWAFSDLRTNIVRGVLAEYLVARAVGDGSPLREAWDNWDVTTRPGSGSRSIKRLPAVLESAPAVLDRLLWPHGPRVV
jgi:hypothetical protein